MALSGTQTTRLHLTATPGRQFGSFAGKEEAAVSITSMLILDVLMFHRTHSDIIDFDYTREDGIDFSYTHSDHINLPGG